VKLSYMCKYVKSLTTTSPRLSQGIMKVNHGANQTFPITHKKGNKIDRVQVEGVS